METHADLIAGLPLYHLHEIFEDVRTLAGYAAGEIQLESLILTAFVGAPFFLFLLLRGGRQ